MGMVHARVVGRKMSETPPVPRGAPYYSASDVSRHPPSFATNVPASIATSPVARPTVRCRRPVNPVHTSYRIETSITRKTPEWTDLIAWVANYYNSTASTASSAGGHPRSDSTAPRSWIAASSTSRCSLSSRPFLLSCSRHESHLPRGRSLSPFDTGKGARRVGARTGDSRLGEGRPPGPTGPRSRRLRDGRGDRARRTGRGPPHRTAATGRLVP